MAGTLGTSPNHASADATGTKHSSRSTNGNGSLSPSPPPPSTAKPSTGHNPSSSNTSSGKGNDRPSPLHLSGTLKPSNPQSLLAKPSSPSNLEPLDGIRVIANCCIILAHTTYAIGRPPNNSKLHEVMQTQLPIAFSLSCFFPAMDTFFCLTGLLATYHLIPALSSKAQAPWHAVTDYYRRRVARLVPHFYLTLLLTLLAIGVGHALGDPNVSAALSMRPNSFPVDLSLYNIALTMLFLHNITYGGVMILAWNLAVQVQFYVLLPLALLALRPHSPGFKARVMALSLALLAYALGHLSWAFDAYGIWLPSNFYQAPGDPGYVNTNKMFDAYYMSFLARLANLSLGMLLGLLALSPAAMEALRKRRTGVLGITAVALPCAAFVAAVACNGPAIDFKEELVMDAKVARFVFTWVFGLMHPGAVTVCVAFALVGAGPAGRLAHALLGHPVWKWPARLSYSVFLMHPLAILVVWRVMATLFHTDPADLFFKARDAGLNSGQALGHELKVLAGLCLAVQGVATAAAVMVDAALGHVFKRFK